MKRNYLLALVTLCGLPLMGCITHHETVYSDAPRTKVEFENEQAGRMFYEALSRMPHAHQRQESKTEVSIPFVFDHEQRVVSGENQTFNEAVRQCDTNGDGKITETEARIFSERH